MKRIKIISISIIILGMFIAGFYYMLIRDSCNQAVTFESVSATSINNGDKSMLMLNITWISQTGLPKEYFRKAELLSESDNLNNWSIGSNDRVVYFFILNSANEMLVCIRPDELWPLDTLKLTFAFPDRREFINCHHLGMDDQYLLNIKVKFNHPPEKEIVIDQFQWTEIFNPGAI